MGWEWIYLKLPSTVILTAQKPLIFLSLKFLKDDFQNNFFDFFGNKSAFSPTLSLKKYQNWAKYSFLKRLFPKQKIFIFVWSRKYQKQYSENIDLQKNTDPQSFFETEMLLALNPCNRKCCVMLRLDQGSTYSNSVRLTWEMIFFK